MRHEAAAFLMLGHTYALGSDHFEIYYEDSGEGQPVIAFQSGYMGIHDIWKFQVEALKGRSR